MAVLAEIMQWIQAIEESKHILWLYGSAGAGKSAIAQTIAEMCSKLGHIVASFFFSRASPSRNNEKRLIASIAYQLAVSIPTTRSYIESAVQTDPAIFDRSLDTQVEVLIIGPLENACTDVDPTDAKQWPRLIIIDGLDECHNPLIQCSIIRVLSAALRRVPFPLILLVASRPEPHIRNTFNFLIKSDSHVSRHIVLDNSYKPDADIKEFLVSRFKEIKENHLLASRIPESWPSEEAVNQLVRKSSGQFIYASTVMKYLDSSKHWPMKRLDAMMGLIPVVGDMPYKELDALYSHILSCVEDLATTLKILGFLFFDRGFDILTPNFLALLLGFDEGDIYLCLSELHSVLYIPPLPNTGGLAIRPTHASLQDFLVDKLRSGKYHLDEEAFHTDLAQQCVRQISTLSMKQALEVPSREKYLTYNFIHHCTCAASDNAELKNDLMQLRDLRPWLKRVYSDKYPYEVGYFYKIRVGDLFPWLYKVCQVYFLRFKIA